MSSEGGLAARRHRAYNETRAVNPSRSRGNIAQCPLSHCIVPLYSEPDDCTSYKRAAYTSEVPCEGE